MTKYTPDYLRSRASNLSLRSASLAASSPSPSPLAALPTVPKTPGPSERDSPTAESKCFQLAGMEGRAPAQNRVCYQCEHRLHWAERLQVSTLSENPEKCVLCALKSVRAEAFTQPFLQFLTENPTIFHTVEYFEEKLEAAGFKAVCGGTPLPLLQEL